MIDILLLIVALLLVAACGAFVAAEFSFITVSRSSVERATEEGDRGAAGVLAALRTLSTQLSGAQLGITLTNLAIGFLAEPVLAKWINGPLEVIGVPENGVRGVALTIALVISTVITMVLGELVPKNLAIARPMGTAKAVQRLQRGFTASTHWLLQFLNGTANRCLRWLNIEPHEELASARTPDELLSLVQRSAQEGTLERETANLLQRSLAFGNRNAADAMTDRLRVDILPYDATVLDVFDLAITTGHSRFPIAAEIRDDIGGVVHIRRAIAVDVERRATTLARTIMQPPLVVPELLELDLLLDQLKASGLQLAVVVDEHGSFVGVVTLEDLIEEIVGEVRDEYDEIDTRVQRVGESGDEWLISGLLRPDEVANRTRVHLPEAEHEEYETVAGLLTERLRRLPEVGDDITVAASVNGQAVLADLLVEELDGFRIDRIRLRVTAIEDDMDGRDSRDRDRDRERDRERDRDERDREERDHHEDASGAPSPDEQQRDDDRMSGYGG